jgi:hypothetical protein
MIIQFKQEGGLASFPGLNHPVVIDTDKLPPAESSELREAVDRSLFFDRPDRVGEASPGAADYREYTITVEDGPRRHSVHLVEPIADPLLQALVGSVRKKARTVQTGN